jgi:hypothetical protein
MLSPSSQTNIQWIAHVGYAARGMVYLLAGIFRWSISPIRISLENFNSVKAGRSERDRLVKLYDPRRLNPDVLVFGTSRVKRGIDPRAINGAVYNAGIDAATTTEMNELLRFYIWSGLKPKEIYIEALIYAFTPGSAFSAGRPHPPIKPSWLQVLSDAAAVALSSAAVSTSAQTIAINFSYPAPFAILDELGYAAGPAYHPGTNFVPPNWQSFLPVIYGTMKLDVNAVAALQDMVRFCRTQGIDFKIFAAPMHPISMLSVWQRGGRELYLDWLGAMTAITPIYSYLLLEQSWETRWLQLDTAWSDSSHFSPKIGADILRDLTSPKLAIVVDRENYGAHVSAIERRLRRWANENDKALGESHQYVQWTAPEQPSAGFVK